MPSFSDSIFLFVLALLLFGPKKLPVLARELGKWVGEFRRASNEFKMQMEEELRQVEQADRQKQIAAMEAAAPAAPLIAAPEHPHLPQPDTDAEADPEADTASYPEDDPDMYTETGIDPVAESESDTRTEPAPQPLPIATSGDLSLMPPATGLPQPRNGASGSALGGLLDSIPEAEPAGDSLPAASAQHQSQSETETAAHGD